MASPAALDLADLVGRLPMTTPTGAPVFRVAVLGVTDSATPEALEAALARRYDAKRRGDWPDDVAADVDALLGGSAEPAAIARVTGALDVDALVVARVTMESLTSSAVDLEVRFLGGRSESHAFALEERTRLAGPAYAAWNLPALGIYVALALLLVRLVPRGSGSLGVHLPRDDRDGNRVTTVRATHRETGADVSRAVSTPVADLLEEIGRGGMGVVYKARDTRLGRVIALKKLPENLKEHPTAVRLFLREAQSVAALNHPNIVTLFDADQDEDGVYFLTMELLEGMPLDKILDERGRLAMNDTLKLAYEISTGLQFAHEQRIVHRDIKPANLFYTRSHHVKIMDFGLAKMVEEVARTASIIAGTPAYMAPEQARGDAIDHRADQYALGCTMFRIVTGRVPFEKGDAVYHHVNTPPPDPRQLAPELAPDLAELIQQLMAKSPDARFATTAEVTARIASIACT